MARNATKKAAPAKKAAAKKTAPAKKAAAKKAPAKRAASNKSSVKLGDTVLVSVDQRQNNGSDQAAATVVRVLDVPGETRVNLQAHIDSADGPLLLRNVPVVSKDPGDGSTFALRS